MKSQNLKRSSFSLLMAFQVHTLTKQTLITLYIVLTTRKKAFSHKLALDHDYFCSKIPSFFIKFNLCNIFALEILLP